MYHPCDSDIECCALLEAERYEIYPTHYYTLSSERKQGHYEISSTLTALHTHFHPLLRFAEIILAYY